MQKPLVDKSSHRTLFSDGDSDSLESRRRWSTAEGEPTFLEQIFRVAHQQFLCRVLGFAAQLRFHLPYRFVWELHAQFDLLGFEIISPRDPVVWVSVGKKLFIISSLSTPHLLLSMFDGSAWFVLLRGDLTTVLLLIRFPGGHVARSEVLHSVGLSEDVDLEVDLVRCCSDGRCDRGRADCSGGHLLW